jgi:hypothetical protein
MAESTSIDAIVSTKPGPDSLAEEQIKIFNDLMAWYMSNRADDHQTIAQYALPQDSNITQSKTEGVAGWTDEIFDTTTIQAVETLANGLYNSWTPQNQPWNEYECPEEVKETDENGLGTQYYAKASDKAMKELGRSNFYMAKATGDIGLATFATDLIIVDESDTGSELFNFIHPDMGTYVIEENYKGIVDTARILAGGKDGMTFRQVEQKFNQPGDYIPGKMRDQARGAVGGKKKFKILHCIFPREDSKRLKGRKDGANKPIASVWISLDFREVMRVGGYEETPILCRRFKKWQSVWGYGPCYLALPDARQANYMAQYLNAGAEMALYQRYAIPDNLDGDVDLRAGGVTVYDSSSPEAKPEQWGTTVEYTMGFDLITQIRKAIKDACYNDAFKLLNSEPLLNKKMTAWEISQRQAEQLQNMTPIDARHIQEFHNPLMKRVFGIMYRRGKLGKAPEVLMKAIGSNAKGLREPEVVSTSRFVDALRALKNRGTQQTIEFVTPLMEARPELLDNFDMDKVTEDFARNSGMAPDLIWAKTGPNSVAAIRQARAKLQQQQRAAALAEQVSKAGKNLGGAPQFMQEQAEQALTGGQKRRAA